MKLSYDPKPGMLVRCVDDEFDVEARARTHNRPVRGIVYTVREVRMREPLVALRLVEVFNPAHGDGFGEPSFLAWRFVPVDPKALDVFRKQSADA